MLPRSEHRKNGASFFSQVTLLSCWMVVASVAIGLVVSSVGSDAAACCWQDDEIPKYEPPNNTMVKFTTELLKTGKGEHFQLEPVAGKLQPKFDSSGNQSRSSIQTALAKTKGASGSMGSSSGGDNWSLYSKGKAFAVSAGHGRRYWNPNQEFVIVDKEAAYYMQFRDLGEDQSLVKVTANPNGAFAVSIIDRGGVHTFDFEQSKSGTVSCIEIGPEFLFADTAASFDEFAAKHPEYVNQRLSPIFQYAGVGEPPSRFHPLVRDQVLNQLKPVDEEKAEKFRALIEPMDEGDYEQREAASKSVVESFKEYESFIESAMADQSNSAEVRSRLKKIYEKKVDRLRRGLLSSILKSDLTNDQEYLVWVLNSIDAEKAPVAFQAVVKQLESVSKESFGDDVDKWSQWIVEKAKENPKKEGVETAGLTTADLMKTDGELDKVKSALDVFFRLKVVDGKIISDRDFWKKSLGGKTVQETCAEVRAFIKEKNLPENWFQPGSSQYPTNSVEMPQVLFDRIVSDTKVDQDFGNRMSAYSRYMFRTANRFFLGEQLSVQLNVHNSGVNRMFMAQQANVNKAKIVQEFLNVDLFENEKARRNLMFRDDRKGNFVAGLRFGRDNASIRLVQLAEADKDGNTCFLATAIGTNVALKRAKDFATLVEDNASEWNEVKPLFAKFGITVSE